MTIPSQPPTAEGNRQETVEEENVKSVSEQNMQVKLNLKSGQ